MANTIWFDSYDFTVNERCFSPEELDTVRDLLSRGERVWMAPVRIEDKGQMETLMISRSKCRMLHVGPESMLVYFTPVNEATYQFMIAEVNREHKEHLMATRCRVPGKRLSFVRCPMCNRCEECPYGRCDGSREPTVISRDAMLVKGFDVAVDTKSPEKIVLRRTAAGNVLERVCQRNEKAGRALLLKELYGYDVPEITRIMDTTDRNVYYYVSEGKRIAKEEWKKEEED